MEIEVDEDLLRTVATGGEMDYGLWPALSQGIISRLDKIAHNAFPIPNLPTPPQPINAPGQQPRLLSPLPSSSIDPASSQPSSQDADKENSQPKDASSSKATVESATDTDAAVADAPPSTASGSLPAQIEAMLNEINTVLASFPKYPPHTIQRLAELVLEPRRHYRHLASYLHAVDRVVHVTSGANTYPLPPAIPDMSTMTLLSNGSANGQEINNPAASVAWSNSTNSVASTVGTDEALGGALLTPIPWLTRRPSPGSSSPASSNGGGPAEIRTESTETIDGPNGVGSIETVSVSVNGIPSMGASSSRAITQEEAQHAAALRSGDGGRASSPETQQQDDEQQDAAGAAAAAEDENEAPHARGPEEIGVGDLGPQSETTSFVGGGPGLDMQGIDVEAAVGRKAATPPPEDVKEGDAATEDGTTTDAVVDDAASDTSITSHPKRDADEELDGLASKKVKEHEGDIAGEATDATISTSPKEDDTKEEDVKEAEPKAEEGKDEETEAKKNDAADEATAAEAAAAAAAKAKDAEMAAKAGGA
ncbi:Protein phosphatase 4 core regulatory subunit R2 [Colletotrichum scovillei]|uniref:Protein phosphatase 4 core regulatory subunit R2 n=1 Tax=Colletotrichum scovillei TaxID=1209932 RepID=A0A9P7U8P5_9PEZI|nr:Protein phosphatase 4 core regulatory subunit R2 [Colletotrichum scovillei]KAG7049259.1 Protein phosphatase 4 core regulatory subunit R2 [Colletotrichum scovillei]KAG7064001.1 Protein phosphatase 4 core regulatory subunit R2 [Colletotrichum scovillei]